ALRDLLDRRFLQHLFAAADENGHVVDAHAEPLERLLHARIAVGVEICVRLAVARQELLQRQGARRVPGPDENDVSRAPGHDQRAPEDERSQKNLAQLRIRLHETAYAFRWQLENAPGHARPSSRDGRAIGYEIDVAGKIASAVDGHGRIPVREDLDLALEYDEERTIPFALLPQNFAGVERSLACERGEPLDLRPR